MRITNGWKEVEIGKIAECLDGDWILSENMSEGGEFGIVQLKHIGEGKFLNKNFNFITNETCNKLKCTILEEGDLIVSRMADPICRSCILPKLKFKTVTSVDVTIVRPNIKLVEKAFLNLIFNSYIIKNQLFRYTTGTTRARISKKNLKKLKIPLPSLEIQRKIISVIGKTIRLKELRKESNELTKDFLKSVFLEMFGDIRMNPKRWVFKKLEDFCLDDRNAIKAGPFGSALKKEFYVDKGYKIYGQEQVILDDLEFGDYYISKEKYKELENYKIQSGDILISLVGTYGKLSIVPNEFKPGIINPRLMKISLDKDKMNPIFFKHLFYSDYIKINLANASHGGTMNIINVGIVKQIYFPIPPIVLQNEFASIATKVESMKDYQKKSEAGIITLSNILFQKSFRGELVC